MKNQILNNSGNGRPPTKVMLRLKEVSDIFGISAPLLNKWRSQGGGPPFIKLGKAKNSLVLYERAALETWLAERTYTNTSEHQEAV